MRILIADDVEDNLLLMRRYLKGSPHEVDTASDGQAALEMFTARDYDLVFMDMQMPVMDGYEATRRIREWEGANRRGSRVPIIGLTGFTRGPEVRKCLDAGCTCVLRKPVDKATLLAAVTGGAGRRAGGGEAPGGEGEVTVEVDSEIADMIPRFLEHRRRDAAAVLEAAEREDYAAVQRVGHALKGVGVSYGFAFVSETGKALEMAARDKDQEKIRRQAEALSAYLSRVKVVVA